MELKKCFKNWRFIQSSVNLTKKFTLITDKKLGIIYHW